MNHTCHTWRMPAGQDAVTGLDRLKSDLRTIQQASAMALPVQTKNPAE
jgi:hypothetical protein